MKKIPSDIQKWNNRWSTEVKYCFPSGGGAVGVIFVYTSVWHSGGGQNAYSPKDAAFVIKPIQGSAAPTKFAETMLSKIASAQSPNSVPIKGFSSGARSLINMLVRFSTIETDPKIRARWRDVMTHYHNADTLLIQETQKGIQELGDAYKSSAYNNGNDGLARILTDRTLMINLGKLYAADTLLGNGDRLGNMNCGNIAFNAQGQILAIDSATVLTDFNAVVADGDRFLASSLTENVPGKWVAEHIHEKGYFANPTARQYQDFAAHNDRSKIVRPPGAAITEVFNIKTWWNQQFKAELEVKLAQHCPTEKSPSPNVWFQAELWFTEGVNEGIKLIDSKLSGLNWLNVKSKYKSYVSKYGGDPNLDWMNFKIRRKYIKLRRKGRSDAEALNEVQEYANRKMHYTSNLG